MAEQEAAIAKESEHSTTWVLEEFSKTMNSKMGTRVTSAPFVLGWLTFELWLYPAGICGATKGYVGLLLDLISPSRARVKFSLSMGHDSIRMFHSAASDETFVSGGYGQIWGNLKLVERQSLLDQVLKFSGDSLMIRCTIYGLDTPEACSRFRILDNYEAFFDNEKLSDIKIVISGKVIHAHRLVLMSGCKVFAAMLGSDTLENKEGVVNIDDIEYHVMLELVRYMYTGKIGRCDIAVELLVAANKYGLDDLVNLCGRNLQANITCENVLEYISFADTHQAGDLMTSARLFFDSHAEEIIARIH